MSVRTYYIYRHIRPDTNQVFYIGKGSVGRRGYDRMRSKERNIWWRRVVALNNGKYIAEVIFECNSEAEAFAKESEFISLYGRADLGKGTLVNLTDGGEGAVGGVIPIHVRDATSKRHSKKVIDLSTGKEYKSAREAARFAKIAITQMCGYLTNNITNTTSFVYVSNLEKFGEEYCRQKLINQTWINKASGKEVVDDSTGKEYLNIKDAAEDLGISVTYLRRMVGGTYANKTSIRYKHPQRKWKRSKRAVVDTNSDIVYESVVEAAKAVGYSSVYVRDMLVGRFPNKTTLKFV